jgi:hypothetical protein
MKFKAPIWYPIAVALSAINAISVGFALGPGETWHAGIHAGLAVAFALWAQRLRRGPGVGDLEGRLEGLESDRNRLDALEMEMSKLREELNQAHERLDFTERILAKGQEMRRVGPEH